MNSFESSVFEVSFCQNGCFCCNTSVWGTYMY